MYNESFNLSLVLFFFFSFERLINVVFFFIMFSNYANIIRYKDGGKVCPGKVALAFGKFARRSLRFRNGAGGKQISEMIHRVNFPPLKCTSRTLLLVLPRLKFLMKSFSISLAYTDLIAEETSCK